MPSKNDNLFLNLFLVLFLMIGVFATVFAVTSTKNPNADAARDRYAGNSYVNPKDYEGIKANAMNRSDAAKSRADFAQKRANSARNNNGSFDSGMAPMPIPMPSQGDEKSIVNACNDLVAKYKAELNNYDSRKDEAKARYDQAKANALALLDTADEMGYDTSEARTAISDIDAKVVALESEVDSLVAKWKNKKIDCNDTDSYAEVQAELRTDMATVRNDVMEIRSEIREVIESLKLQVNVSNVNADNLGGPGHEDW